MSTRPKTNRNERKRTERVAFLRREKITGFPAQASTLALSDPLRARLAAKLAAELPAGALVFSSTKLFAGESEVLVVANSWSLVHEVVVATIDGGTAVDPRLARHLTGGS